MQLPKQLAIAAFFVLSGLEAQAEETIEISSVSFTSVTVLKESDVVGCAIYFEFKLPDVKSDQITFRGRWTTLFPSGYHPAVTASSELFLSDGETEKQIAVNDAYFKTGELTTEVLNRQSVKNLNQHIRGGKLLDNVKLFQGMPTALWKGFQIYLKSEEVGIEYFVNAPTVLVTQDGNDALSNYTSCIIQKMEMYRRRISSDAE